jgi:hypothetical protein
MSSTRLAAPVKASRASVIVRASNESVDRRQAFGLFAAAVGAALIVTPEAKAIKLTSQAFTGGLGAGGGNMPKSTSAASMSAFDMEGTKKMGVTGKRKAALLAKVRAQAAKTAAPS